MASDVNPPIMKFLLLAVLTIVGLYGQVQAIGNIPPADVRPIINNNFTYLDQNKAGLNTCPANQFGVQTTKVGLVCLPPAFLQTGIGAVSRPLASKVGEVISVMDYGAVGNGSTDDTTAISNAIAAACAHAYAPRVVFPSPPGSYIVTGTLNLCSQIDVYGYGHPIIDYSGTGALFQFTATPLYHPNIHGFTLRGNKTSGQIGILLQGVTAFQAHFYDMSIYQFGDAATHTGAGIEILNSDSASMSITNVEFGNDGDAFFMTNSSADGLNFSENHVGGTGYGVSIEGGAGAGAARITHNVFDCIRGAVKYNPTFGFGIIDHNEHEATDTATDPNGAIYSFLAGIVYVNNNLSTSHGYAAYDFYVGNGVNYSTFNSNIGGASTSAAFYVGMGALNTYSDNRSLMGGATNSALYSNPNYPGIVIAPTSGAPGSTTYWRGDGVWASPQTPWTSDIDAGAHSLSNLRSFNVVGLDTTNSAMPAINLWAGAGNLRWSQIMTTPETSGNAGSNWTLLSFTDAGAYLGTPITVNRSTGVVNFSATPTVNGVPLAAVLKPAGGTVGTCNAAARGQIVILEGVAGVADKVQICVKNASDAYVWASLF